jgi:DNA excision repair protein ERCC-4
VSAELQRLAPAASAPADVTADMTATERLSLYASASHLFVTTRIVVVDLLTRRLPAHNIAGLLVMNAHRATDQSGEGFAVRLLRGENRNGFVRGLSDDPGLAGSGLSSLERTMRALHVKEVYLWPRFQSTVQHDLCAVDVRHPLLATRHFLLAVSVLPSLSEMSSIPSIL